MNFEQTEEFDRALREDLSVFSLHLYVPSTCALSDFVLLFFIGWASLFLLRSALAVGDYTVLMFRIRLGCRSFTAVYVYSLRWACGFAETFHGAYLYDALGGSIVFTSRS